MDERETRHVAGRAVPSTPVQGIAAAPGRLALLVHLQGSTVASSTVASGLVKVRGQPREPKGETRERPR